MPPRITSRPWRGLATRGRIAGRSGRRRCLIRLGIPPVPIDRPAALRNAEKFLRLGRLEEAIAEYRSVLDDQPLDWNTANALGDLYVRAGQLDQAVAQFVRTADTLARGGFVVRASALYKKILKFRPDHEYSLLRAAEIAASQGLMADARACLSSIVERRRARGDHAGVAEMMIQLA
ncbi:MAG: hypothetical protein DMF89_15430, partial [Acidobacteria bacterium]